jgi:hypothetical protein
MASARCHACSVGGKVAKRKANVATHLLVLVLNNGENRVELACDRHARMACKVYGNFAVQLQWPVMTSDTLAVDGTSGDRDG